MRSARAVGASVDPRPRAARAHRPLTILVTMCLAAETIVMLLSNAGAVVNSCRAKDLTKGTPSLSNLQRVIKDADRGDTIAVKNVCVGGFHVGKSLAIVGRATLEVSRPVLTAVGADSVLRVGARVTLANLEISGGNVPDGDGGGILNLGALTLRGSTVVTGNTANRGGGIYNKGTLTLNGSSSVSGNSTSDVGGGIYNARATVTLNDSASVNGNTAWLGGGIWNSAGTLTLNGSSSVSDNTAGDGDGSAGGIYNSGVLTLNDTSSVARNSADRGAGGIFNIYGSLTMNGESSVTGNTADADDDGLGVGGGIKNSGCVIGVVAGGNVSDNHLGSGKESNIAGSSVCP